MQNQAKGKNVGARVRIFRLQLLRRHVVQRADYLPLLGERLREVGFLQQTTLLREPEVEQLDPLLRNEYVARFQIPMSDALLMCRIQRVENLARVVDGLFERQRSLQRSAVNQFHYQVIRADVVELADIRMIQLRYRPGFMLEALAELILGNFDCDVAAEPRVAGAVHFSHSTRADRRKDFIGAEFCAGRQRHIKTQTSLLAHEIESAQITAHPEVCFPPRYVATIRSESGSSPRRWRTSVSEGRWLPA